MEQRTKNIRLIVTLFVLIGISVVLLVLRNGSSSRRNITDLFQIKDTTGITSVTISSKDFNNQLQKTDSGWVINENYLVDQSMMIVLFSVMQNVEVQRAINTDTSEDDLALSEKINIEFKKGQDIIQSFYASANPRKTLSIFSKENQAYVVNIPGYDSFVTGIFEIPASDWRNRLIVSLGPFNMDAIEINYPKSPDKNFRIEVENNFPFIPDVHPLDTMKLMDYLEQFSYFQVDQYTSPDEDAAVDSILQTEPWIDFSFREINVNNNVTLKFFHKKRNDPNIYALLNEHQPVLFNYRRIAGIFKEKEDFIRE